MSTIKRPYYTDSYTVHFSADVCEHTQVNDSPAVVLTQSYFYPTSGGQPHDTGTLNSARVVDVFVRESDDAVVHVLDRPLDSDHVQGRIDWERRFDHMQHHTGQHILSQAFVHVADAETIGFHLSADSVTIDLDKLVLDQVVIDAAEDLANRIVTENHPVRAWFPTEDELPDLPLRKMPEVNGQLRVVAVGEFDWNACGGTHVAHTGEIGLIKVLRADRRGDSVRIEFRCGKRAMLDYRTRHAVTSLLAAQLTTGFTDVPASLEKLREENKTLRRELRTLQAQLLEQEAHMLVAGAVRTGEFSLIVRVFEDRDAGEVRQLVQQLIAQPGIIVLCGIVGEKSQLIAARSDDLAHDMVPVLKRGLAALGVDRGGGRPSFAQGGGIAASHDTLQAALDTAAEYLHAAANE